MKFHKSPDVISHNSISHTRKHSQKMLCNNIVKSGEKNIAEIAYGTSEEVLQWRQINIYRLFSDLLLQRHPLLSNGISCCRSYYCSQYLLVFRPLIHFQHQQQQQSFFIWKMKTLHWSIYVFQARYRYAFLYVLLQYFLVPFAYSQLMTMAMMTDWGDSIECVWG